MGEQKAKKQTEEDALKEAEEMLKTLKDQKQKESQPKVDNPMDNKGEEQAEKHAEANKVTKEEKKETSDKVTNDEVTPLRQGSAGQAKKDKSLDSARDKKKKVKVRPPKKRSKKYQAKIELIDRTKQYELSEALELVKKTAYAKFGGSVEMHIRLVPPKNKKIKQEQIRGNVTLPHSIGKEPKVGVIDEAMTEKILKEKKTEFNILLATPDMMPKIAKLAKILGPKGMMPNPKTGTVTADPKKTIDEIKAGRVEYKSDNTGNVHQMLGKVAFDNKKLEENYQAMVNVIGAGKIQSVTLSATMGPGIKVKI